MDETRDRSLRPVHKVGASFNLGPNARVRFSAFSGKNEHFNMNTSSGFSFCMRVNRINSMNGSSSCDEQKGIRMQMDRMAFIKGPGAAALLRQRDERRTRACGLQRGSSSAQANTAERGDVIAVSRRGSRHMVCCGELQDQDKQANADRLKLLLREYDDMALFATQVGIDRGPLAQYVLRKALNLPLPQKFSADPQLNTNDHTLAAALREVSELSQTPEQDGESLVRISEFSGEHTWKNVLCLARGDSTVSWVPNGSSLNYRLRKLPQEYAARVEGELECSYAMMGGFVSGSMVCPCSAEYEQREIRIAVECSTPSRTRGAPFVRAAVPDSVLWTQSWSAVYCKDRLLVLVNRASGGLYALAGTAVR
ncbi:hypothetical protein FVE85_9156 [Porphyridium purpureum]|uniref:Uncharacterized protein n=1 Tax=Porphyridium purpureum TaxID=35688 RepID=A0A5J4YQB5_PORPP|nr:hypothetical protein FVE85_5031 [Porphyridium purpureum]KAA8492884.1 hypothetical protein FVE85_9156 [Porphyridium purpureum]|eukprot:POR4773..scf237_24